MKPQICISLVLTGSFEPDLVQKEIQLPFESSWKEGEAIPDTKLLRKCCGLAYSIPKVDSFDFESQIQELLDFVSPKRKILLDLAQDENICLEVACVIYSYGEFPALHLSPESIGGIKKLGAHLDIDIIFLGEDESS